MPYRVVADHTEPSPPYPVSITVTCDGDHGLFDPPRETFDCTDCHPYDRPRAAGWKFKDSRVYCPECR